MLTNQEFEIIEEIMDWLDTLPVPNEVRYYVRHFPEQKYQLLDYVINCYAQRLAGEKESYFRSNGCDYFVMHVSEIEQLAAIQNLARYNSDSVLKNLKKTYKELNFAQFPSGVAEWARTYFKRWQIGGIFTTARDYDKLSLYAHSFVNANHTADSLLIIEDGIRKEYLNIGTRYDGGVEQLPSDTNELRELFEKMAFFPQQYIEEIIQPKFIENRKELFKSLLIAITLLSIVSVEKARSDWNAFLFVLQDHLLMKYGGDVLTQLESNRLTEFEPMGGFEEIRNYILDSWDILEIQARNVQSRLTNFYASLAPEKQKIFVKYLYASLRESTALEVVVNPLSMDFIITRLQAANDNPVQIEELAEEWMARLEYPSYPEVFKKVIEDICFVIRSFPEAGNEGEQNGGGQSITQNDQLTQPQNA